MTEYLYHLVLNFSLKKSPKISLHYTFQVVLTTRNDIKVEKREKESPLVGFKRNYFKFVDPGRRIFT